MTLKLAARLKVLKTLDKTQKKKDKDDTIVKAAKLLRSKNKLKKEEHGAGFEGTDELVKKYKKDTPSEAWSSSKYYLQPDGKWKKGADGRSKGKTKAELDKDGLAHKIQESDALTTADVGIPSDTKDMGPKLKLINVTDRRYRKDKPPVVLKRFRKYSDVK